MACLRYIIGGKENDPRAGYLLGGITASRVLGYRAHAPRMAMPMLLGIRGGRNNSPMLAFAVCPICGARGNFRPHGHYYRWKANASAFGRAPDKRVRTDRVFCRGCRRTHALIPLDLIPRSPYPKLFRRLAASAARVFSVRRACADYCLSVRTYYRICPSRGGPSGRNRL